MAPPPTCRSFLKNKPPRSPPYIFPKRCIRDQGGEGERGEQSNYNDNGSGGYVGGNGNDDNGNSDDGNGNDGNGDDGNGDYNGDDDDGSGGEKNDDDIRQRRQRLRW